MTNIEECYRARKGQFEIIRVPKALTIAIEGQSAPESDEFSQAIGALYSVAFGAKFAIKAKGLTAPKVMPLESLWWMDGDPTTWREVPRESWRWRMFLVQLPPITPAVLKSVIAATKTAKPNPALDRMEIAPFTEGLCAQLLHVGPYNEVGGTFEQLLASISEAGYEPSGRHHEIYLGDPRRSAPEKLRTLVRMPVRKAGKTATR